MDSSTNSSGSSSSLGSNLNSDNEGNTTNDSIDDEVFHSALDMLDEQERAKLDEYDAQVAEAWRIHNKYHPIATE